MRGRGWCRVPLACGLALACSTERPRPSPVGPDAEPRLSVEVLAPVPNATVFAGRTVQVEVEARDLNRLYLAGFGFVARRVEFRELIDSVVVSFPVPQAVARDTFEFQLPASYATNTHVEIVGLAFGPRGQSRASVPRYVTVVQCRPGMPICE